MTARERHWRRLDALRLRERRLWGQLVRVYWQRVLATPYVVATHHGHMCGWCGRGLRTVSALCPCLAAPLPSRRGRRRASVVR